MNEDDVLKVGADFSGIQDALSELQQSFQESGTAVDKFVRIYKGIDELGRSIQTWRVVTDAGEKLITTFEELKDGVKVLRSEIVATNYDLLQLGNAKLTAQKITKDLTASLEAQLEVDQRVNTLLSETYQRYQAHNEVLSQNVALVREHTRATEAYFQAAAKMDRLPIHIGPTGSFADTGSSGSAWYGQSAGTVPVGSSNPELAQGLLGAFAAGKAVAETAGQSAVRHEEAMRSLVQSQHDLSVADEALIAGFKQMMSGESQVEFIIESGIAKQVQAVNALKALNSGGRQLTISGGVSDQLEQRRSNVEAAHAEALAEEETFNRAMQMVVTKRIREDEKDIAQYFATRQRLTDEAHAKLLADEADFNRANEKLVVKRVREEEAQQAAIYAANQRHPTRADFIPPKGGGGDKPPPGFGAGFSGGLSGSTFGDLSANALGFAAGGAILQGVNMLGSALKQGAEDAVEFDRRMARLSVTEAGTTSATNRLAHEVLDLSNKFNLDKFDVAQARYKAVAQGATDAAHAQQFLNQTLGLAQVTGTSAEQATVAVASAIRAFGLHVSDAQHVSELLFQTWKDGNVDINNLGDNLGRIGAVASPLGFKLEEIIALFVTFRQRGIEGGEAISTLSNWVQRLSAPTPELTTRLKELGFATAEEAVRSGHLAEVLQLLGKEASISGENIVKMLGGIRTSRGGLAEIGFFQEAIDNAKKFAKETHTLEARVEETTNHTGEHLTKLGTELKNYFTTLGLGIVQVLDQATKAVEVSFDKNEKAWEAWRRKQTHESAKFAKDHAEELSRNEQRSGRFLMSPTQQVDDASHDAAADKLKWAAASPAQKAAMYGVLLGQMQPVVRQMRENVVVADAEERIKAESNAALAIKKIYMEKVESEERAEKLLTEKLKDQLAIRLSRFEDSVRQHMEVAARAKEISRQAQENIVTINEDYATAKYGRQMSLLTPEQQAMQLQASLPGSQVQLPWLEGGLGNTNLIAQRMKSLQQDREDHVDALSTKTGDAFLASKDLEKSQKDSQEIGKIQADQFVAVAEAYKNHKATLDDVRAVERSITAEKDKQLELQKKIQEAMDKKAADEKAAADAEKERLAQVKDASEKALALTYDRNKQQNPLDLMNQFNQFRTTAMTNVSPTEYAGMAQLFEAKKKELSESITRGTTAQGISGEMETALKAMNDTAGLKNLGKDLDGYVDKQTKIFKDLEEHIKELIHPDSAGGTGRIVDEHGNVVTRTGLKTLTKEQLAEKEEAAKAETEVKVKEAYAYASGKLAGPYVAGLSGAAPTAGNRAGTETRDEMIARMVREQNAYDTYLQKGGKSSSSDSVYVGEAVTSPPKTYGQFVNSLQRTNLLGAQPADGYDFAPQASPKYQAASQTNTGSVQGGTQFNMTVNSSDGPANVEMNPIIMGIKQAERQGKVKISDREMTPGEYARWFAEQQQPN